MLKQLDQLLVERSGPVGWLGLQTVPPQGYRTRKGGSFLLWESAVPIDWDDDDVATEDEDDDDDEEEDEDDELLPDDEEEDEEDDDDDLEEDE